MREPPSSCRVAIRRRSHKGWRSPAAQVRGMVFEAYAFLRRLGPADAARDDNVAEQQFCLYNSSNGEISLIRHRKREDVRWLVLAAPLGIKRADLLIAGQRDRYLDPPL